MISLIKKYLDLNQYSNAKGSFVDLYQSHPNFPSLFSITDSFDALGIENVAAKIPKEQFPELPNIFLANCNNEIVLVDKSKEFLKIDYQNGDRKTISTNQFLDEWNGIIVAIEPNEKLKIDALKLNFNPSTILVLTFGLLSTVGAIAYFGVNYFSASFIITSIIGIVFSVFILQEKFGIKNEITSKICSGNDTSCFSVIQSDKNKIGNSIYFSDLSIVFFVANLFSLLLNPNQSIYLISMTSVLAIPLVVYAVWLQKVVLKKWCTLCLVISFLIVLQASSFWYFYQKNSVLEIILGGYYYYFSLGLIFLSWYFVSPLLESKIQATKKIAELIRFKRNFKIFNSLSKPIQSLFGFNELKGIKFGNATAKLKLTLFLSPSCTHCDTAFEDAYNLYLNQPTKVEVRVLFNVNPNNADNPYLTVVQNLLNINIKNNNKVLEAIIDWHIHKMELNKWLTKWATDEISSRVGNQILSQYNWCKNNDFNYSPVKIVNSKILSDQYNISELHYFLNDFLDTNQEGTPFISHAI